ncbi:MAG: AAA+-type ATPase [Trizodia sp. TS-e1964]|nr:MAG: AAA+-type ATPase [Trizodia sp. TS-e1964]
MTAQALASEAGLNFMAVKGAELLSMYVGESERAVRELFRRARNARPSIIFLDEIDSIGSGTKGPSQNNGLNVVTTLLNELDGIEVLEGVTVVAATNKPESLDAALLRPGRFDTILYVGPPDLSACKEILKIRTSKMAIADDLNIDELAQNLYGYSGAEIADICDKAGYAAIEEFLKYGHKAPINRSHFEIALGEVERQITTAMKTKYENWSVASDKWSL